MLGALHRALGCRRVAFDRRRGCCFSRSSGRLGSRGHLRSAKLGCVVERFLLLDGNRDDRDLGRERRLDQRELKEEQTGERQQLLCGRRGDLGLAMAVLCGLNGSVERVEHQRRANRARVAEGAVDLLAIRLTGRVRGRVLR